jgi:hypothetical protein
VSNNYLEVATVVFICSSIDSGDFLYTEVRMDPLPEGVYYTAHYNWEPWLNLALVGATQMQRARELPSQRGLSKDERAPPSYALFRAEALEPKAGREAAHESTESVKSPVDAADRTCDEKETVGKGPPVKVSGTLLRRAWATSRCAEQLDPKDNLFRLARQGGASLCFPPTRLLPYDFDLTCGSSKSNSASSRAASASHDHSSNPSGTRASANDSSEGNRSSGNNNKSDGNRSSMVSEPPLVPLHGPRQLLKAPLGSGGNGLYFVESDHEVIFDATYPLSRHSSLIFLVFFNNKNKSNSYCSVDCSRLPFIIFVYTHILQIPHRCSAW